jgi:glycosyltransferase involved in cell wall biosynthesis
MKLLIVVPSRARGGTEEYCLTIARGAVEQGWNVAMGMPVSSGTSTFVAGLGPEGIESLPIDLASAMPPHRRGRLVALTHDYVVAWLALRKARPDAVLLVLPVPSLGLGVMAAAASAGVPLASVFQLVPAPFAFGLLAPLYALLRKRGQRYVAVSGHNRNLLATSFGIPAADISLVPNGVTVHPADDASRGHARRALRHLIGVSPEVRIVITVGRLHAQKEPVTWARAVSRLAPSHPDVIFVWVGAGDKEDEVAAYIRGHGDPPNVRLLGFRDDVRALLRGSDLFVLPSLYEGQPFALLEAFAEGLPAVVANTGVLADLVTDGRNGWLFHPGDADDLARVVAHVLRNPQARTDAAVSAFESVQSYTQESMVHAVLREVERAAR